MKKIKKTVSCMIAMFILLSSMMVFAVNTSANVSSGQCGHNVMWSISDDKVLTISGEGAMYDDLSIPPWDSLSFTTLVIEEGVTTISYNAFGYSHYLETAYIPASVIEIGDYAFMKCPQFTELYYAGNMADWKNIFMGNSLLHDIVHIHFADGTLAGVCGNNVFWSLSDDKVLTISGKGAIYDNVIPWDGLDYTTLVIEDGVVNISYGAFAYSNELKSVYIPLSVTEIGDYAFMKCPQFTELYYAGSQSDWKSISMGISPFHDIVNFHFDGDKPLNACGDKVTWSLSDEGTLIISGEGPMYDYIYPSGESADNPGWFEHRKDIKSVIINDGVTSIGDSAFINCDNISSVTIPGSVTKIGNRAFFYCNYLTSVVIPSGVEKIDDLAFANCQSLESVLMSDSLTHIGEGAFSGCRKLKSIVIPESVSFIGSRTFNGCNNLASASIPKGITSIGESVFNDCVMLESVNIPDAVTSIGDFAFFNCKSLKSIYIPGSLTYVGMNAFGYCTTLSDVYYTGTEKMWSNIEISNNNTNLINAKKHCYLLEGDINSDGNVNTKDSNLMKRILLRNFEPNNTQLAAGDLDNDGRITTKDIYLLKRLQLS